ncbi:hypothetical protein AB5I83_23405 [Mesobacillus sp. LC4]
MDYFQNAFDEVISKYLEEIKDDVKKQTKLIDNIEKVTKDTIKKVPKEYIGI